MKFRVLLVEEDPEMARQIVGMLDKAGMECKVASEVASGLKMFQSEPPPQLVLLSLGLPNVGGVVLCPEIRKTSTVPIAIVSVRTRREDHLHALNLGADEFITVRPYDEQLLMARLLALLRRAYRYDLPRPAKAKPLSPAETLPAPNPSLPEGWVTCESCDYMGPRNRFERLDAQGQPINRCPHCERSQTLRYVVS
jgi:DNA-binding response OmpR family regulator